ncbi:MAG TPA: S49 family peptidase [Bryobacteraceae bacterium]
MNFLHLQTRIFDTPLAIQPAKLEVILQAIGSRLGLPSGFQVTPVEAAMKVQAATPKAYSVTQEGIAIIPIQGTLMKKTSGLMALSGCTSYEALANELSECVSSPQVKGILLDIDSPGGEVSGLFDLADAFYNARASGKPIYAVSNESAFSAAYALASCADKIFITRTAGVGSVGVFCLHVDQSSADAKAGLKYTYVKAGAKKTEGNPHQPLSEQAATDLQAEVDREYQMFVELVARNRGANVRSVIDTEAGCFFADNALPLLADEVGTFEDALAALSEAVSISGTEQGAFINTSATTNEGHKQMKTVELNATEDNAVLEAAIVAEKADDEMETPEYAAVPDDGDGDEDEPEDDEKKKPEASTSDIKQIMNLCKLASVDITTASDFINKGYSVQQVIDALATERSTRSNKTKVNTTINSTTANTIDALQEQALASANDDPKKALATFKSLLKKNPSAYVQYVDTKMEALALPSTKRKYIAELEAKHGQKVA